MPTLSIIIPAYNEERYIGKLLEQVRAVDLAPSASNKEIIVVDDCSARSHGVRCPGIPGVRLHRHGGERREGRGGTRRASTSRRATT